MHVWLKYYISERLAGNGNRPSTKHYLITFMTSAFWHGFYPFYYVAFTFALFASFAHKDVYGMWILFRGIPSAVRTGACIVVNSFCVNYALCLQNALTFEKGLRFLSATWYAGFTSMILIIVAARVFGLLAMAKKMERAEREKSEKKPVDQKLKTDSKTTQETAADKKSQ